MRPLFLLAMTSLATLCACAQAGAPQPDTLTLKGQVVLKGSSPVAKPVLMTERDGQWELQGVSPEQATALQAQQVSVTGRVLRAPTTGAVPPRLEVESMQVESPR